MKMFTKMNTIKIGILSLVLATGSFFYFNGFQNHNFKQEVILANQEKIEKYSHLTQDEIKKMPKKDRPDLAMQQEFEMTKNPFTGKVNTQNKIEAFKYAKKLLKQRKERGAIPNVEWTERGPNNVAGRTRGLMFDPNDPTSKKAWGGANGGGIWYTNDITDPNTRWNNVDDFMANISISYITYDPSNTQHFYASTGSGFEKDVNGAGIFKSTDAGQTWSQLSSTANEDFVFIQKLLFTSSNDLLAASITGVMKSTDGGESWTNVLEGLAADLELAIDGTLYASTGVNSLGKMYKSTDNGDNWTDISSNLNSSAQNRIEMATAPSDASIIYAVADGGSGSSDTRWFKKSTDGGDTWTDLPIPYYREQSGCADGGNHFTRGQAGYDLILKVHPVNPNIAYVGGIDIYRTTNGGDIWDLVSYWTGECAPYVHADQHSMAVRPGYPNEMIFGSDGGIAYSANVGDKNQTPSFVIQNNDYNVTTFYSCAAANEINSNVFLAGSQDNGTQRFVNPLINSTTEASGGDGGYCFIDQDNSNFQIASLYFNYYRLSVNGGQSFSTILNDQSKGRFINPTEYDSEANILYAAGDLDEISRIKDITNEFVHEYVSVDFQERQITAITASPYTDNLLIVGVRVVGGEGKLFKVENADSETPIVTEITGNYDGLHGEWIRNIDIGSSDDHLLATFSNSGINSVYETTDGGANWNNKEGNLPDIPVKWGIYNPNNRNEVLLATDVGIWSTTDVSVESPDWEPAISGLANVRCDMLKYRSADGLVAVATFGRGLFTTDIFSSVTDANFVVNEVINYAGNDIAFFDASLGAGGVYAWDFGDGNTSDQKNPTHSYSAAGSYTVTLSIANGGSTVSKTDYVTILPQRGNEYTEAQGGDFESNITDFVANNISGTPFELGSSAVSGKDGTASGANAWVTSINDDVTLSNSRAELYTPEFDFSSIYGSYILKFKTKFQFEDNWDGFILEYTTDNGNTWTKLNEVQDEENWYNQITVPQAVFGAEVPIFSGDTDGEFVEKQTDVGFLSGRSKVGFRFLFLTDAGTNEPGMALDDFSITPPAAGTVTVDLSSDVTEICAGETVTFSPSVSGSVTSVNWDFGNGQTANGFENYEITYNEGGTYTVQLQANGGEASKSIEIKVNANPIDKALDQNITTCEFSPSYITIPSSEVGVTYQLYRLDTESANGDPVVGDGTDITLVSIPLSNKTTFYVTATNDSGCSTRLSNFVTVTMDARKVGEDITYKDGLLHADSEGTEFIWYLNGEVIEGATSQTHTPRASVESDDIFRVTVTYDNGCVFSTKNFFYGTTNLTETSFSKELKVFPVPSNGVYNLEMNLGQSSDLEIRVYNSLGQMVKNITKSTKGSVIDTQIDITGMNKGIYIIELVTNKGTAYKRVLKN